MDLRLLLRPSLVKCPRACCRSLRKSAAGKIWSLTDSGRDAARQLLLDTSPDDPVVAGSADVREAAALGGISCERRCRWRIKPSTRSNAKRFIVAEHVQTERDPLRAPAERLRIELTGHRLRSSAKLNKSARELLAFLELHPGSHNLKEVEGVGEEREHRRACFSLAYRRGDACALKRWPRGRLANQWARHMLQLAQQAAFDCDRSEPSGAQTVSRPSCFTGSPDPAKRRSISTRLTPRSRGTQRATAGAGNRPHARHGRTILLTLRGSGGDSAQRFQRFRARRTVAQNSSRAAPAWWWARAPASSRRYAISV